MSGFLHCIQRTIVRWIEFALGPQVDEKAVSAIDIWTNERLAIDRDQPLAVLAC